MARLIIDTGTLGNPATGDTLRTAMTKANDNFAELYTDLAETTSSNGILTTGTTNGDVKIFPNGTGIVEIDRLSLNNTTISSLDTNADINILPGGTGGVVLGGQVTAGEIVTNQITSNGSNANLKLITAGIGDLIIDTDGQVGIGTVNSPDSKLHIKSASSIITLQRTADANKPGLDFQNSNGNVRAELRMDGTDGTSNTVFVRTYDGSSTAERFRVTHTGAKVTGTLDVDGGISITDNTITTSASNANLELTASGTGSVKVDAILSLPDGSASDNYVGVGDGDDLKLFHNGSHSIIRETGTGSLYIQSDNNVIIGKDSSSETMIKGVADGAVELYHDDTKKFETTSGGVSVTGNLAADGTQIDFTNLPTSDPGVAGRLFRSGNDVKISTG